MSVGKTEVSKNCPDANIKSTQWNFDLFHGPLVSNNCPPAVPVTRAPPVVHVQPQQHSSYQYQQQVPQQAQPATYYPGSIQQNVTVQLGSGESQPNYSQGLQPAPPDAQVYESGGRYYIKVFTGNTHYYHQCLPPPRQLSITRAHYQMPPQQVYVAGRY